MSTTKSRRKGSVAAVRGGERRRRLMLISAAVAILVLFAAAIGFGLYRAQQAAGAIPPGATQEGVPVGNPNAPVTLNVYEDFQCPACARFEETTGSTIEELIEAGTVRVVYHPVAYLDRMSSTNYSSRASAAAGCAAAEDVYPEFSTRLFEQQPMEGGGGLPPQTLIEIGRSVGAGPGFADCVQNETYQGWTDRLTDMASRNGITGTPTVLVNGQEVADRSPAGLRAAVAAAQPG